MLHCDNTLLNSFFSFFFFSLTDLPRNIKIEGTTSVKVGSTLTLTCSAESNPQPHSYTWKHIPGLSSFSLSMNNKELKIEKVTIQHAGQYTCDVTNTIGTRSHTIKADVLCKSVLL